MQTDVNYLEYNKKLSNNHHIQKLIHCLNQTENIFMHFILKTNVANEIELKKISIRCITIKEF